MSPGGLGTLGGLYPAAMAPAGPAGTWVSMKWEFRARSANDSRTTSADAGTLAFVVPVGLGVSGMATHDCESAVRYSTLSALGSGLSSLTHQPTTSSSPWRWAEVILRSGR